MSKKKLNIIGGIIFGLIVIALVGKNVFEKQSLDKNSRYTVGKVTEVEANMKGGYRVTFIYDVQGEHYNAFGKIYEKNYKLIGKRFFVRFSPSRPKNCKLLLDKPVLNEIITVPPEGWKEIPK